MHVDNPREVETLFEPGIFEHKAKENTMGSDLRSSKVGRNDLQYLEVRFLAVIEPRCVDEADQSVTNVKYL